MTENKLLDRPENIFNVDETGITMEHSPAKVVCAKGLTPQSITSSRGKNLTIIACGSAAGTQLPPFYIFPGKRWNEDLMKDTSPGANGCMTDSGWSNSEVFLEYMETHFKTYVPMTGDPKLVLFDGHKSHINLTLAEWGRKNNVVFFVLPPHTSHITQPLDVGCFGPLKSAHNRECQSFLRQHPGQQITLYDIGGISSRAYNKAITADNLTAFFRKTGIYPFNKDSIEDVKLAPAVIYCDNEMSDKENSSNSFLESRKIRKAQAITKKRATPPSVTGNLSASVEVLKKPVNCVKKSLEIVYKPEKSSKVEKEISSPQPSTSGAMIQKSIDNYKPDSSDDEFDTETGLCCICQQHNADGLNLAYVVEFVNWGQCDKCCHWTHLKYCSKIRCLRRGSEFLPPL